ncbi:hypothetical protein [Butyrivibrio sp. XPD2002]|uniref:hypothetical protein n=1 Tax=Butyrivibrio sp. XPD2002 TaxID=1280665 RepID=UPI0004131D37|nr:hypothetical protein [Butyrivibrio sp. XPD2002]
MSGNRTNNSIKNIKYSAINKIVTMFLSLIGRYIFLQILPIDYLGINGVFSDIFIMMSLADLGLTTAMAYSFYKPLAENDNDKITALVTLYRKIYNTIAATIAFIGLLLLPFLDYLIKTDLEIPHLRQYYLISLLKLTTDAGIMLIFCYITSFIVGRIACDKLWIWGLKGVLCSTIVILLYFIRYAGNKEMKEIWMKIGSVIGKRNKK